ncbi:DNA cytosine methyltransferase [Lysinibacillus sp. FSL M8-0337]|uniref:DNA cytosine methyltransferase n=1 Tax=Lysinibacillus TaxID=400634 RepID=UPI00084A783C|nr:DNA cytosine methyltransferase [Lysinibacillus sphaericus]
MCEKVCWTCGYFAFGCFVTGEYNNTVKIFNEYLSDMEVLGYTNSYQVSNAMDRGIPQTRERVFCISILGNNVFDFSKVKKRPLRPMSDFKQPDDEIENIEKYVVNIPSMLSRLEDLATPEKLSVTNQNFVI